MDKSKHRVGLLLVFLFCSAATYGQECTTVIPTEKQLVQRGNALTTTVAIQFAGATVNNTWEFLVTSGQTQVLDIAFNVCVSLTNHAAISTGTAIIPTEDVPTPKEQSILDITEAARQLCALENYALLVGLTGAEDVAGTTLSLNGRRGVLAAVFATNATTWSNVKTRMLDEWPRCSLARDVAVALP